MACSSARRRSVNSICPHSLDAVSVRHTWSSLRREMSRQLPPMRSSSIPLKCDTLRCTCTWILKSKQHGGFQVKMHICVTMHAGSSINWEEKYQGIKAFRKADDERGHKSKKWGMKGIVCLNPCFQCFKQTTCGPDSLLWSAGLEDRRAAGELMSGSPGLFRKDRSVEMKLEYKDFFVSFQFFR